MIEAVLFDMDGLLIDSEREYDKAMKEAITRYGHRITDDFLISVRGIPVKEFKKRLKLEFGRDFPVEKFRNDFKSKVWENIRQYGMPVKNGAHQLIQYLVANGIRYSVATSNDRAMALELLEAADLRGAFQYMVCGDEVENGKPFPDIYLKAADLLGVNIKNALVLEDSYNGIRAGYSAGARVIMVPDLVQPTDEIRQMTDYVVNDLGKVISCISNF